MEFDPVLLARLQFAFTIIFHIIFPSFTIGLSAYIATLGVLWLRSGEERFQLLMRFWVKIFAVSFAMGVVSGIVLSYQFGTNWSRFSVATGNVLGPLLGYEVLTAFFLEATFLGVLLFGFNKVPRWLYVLSATVVAVGTMISAFWILAANSWMQTPQGHVLIDGIFFPTSWIEIIFNPSFPYRFAHMVVACFVTTGFVVLAVAAYLMRQGRYVAEGRKMLSMTFKLLTVLVPLQMVIGDQHGLNTREHQPAKLAAIEAHWETGSGIPLILFALPDQAGEKNRAVIEVPRLGSLILTHEIDGTVQGLKDFPPDQRPPVAIVFFSFRIMVGMGLVMLGIVVLSWYLRIRKRLYETAWFLRLCEYAWPVGFIAVLAGWVTTEVGRQPWTVYGLLRTADSVSLSFQGHEVLISLIAYMVVYLMVYPVGVMLMWRLVKKGPGDLPTPPVEAGRSKAPVAALSPARREGGES